MVERVLDSYSSGSVFDSDLVKTSIGGPIVRDEAYYNARLEDARDRWLRLSCLKSGMVTMCGDSGCLQRVVTASGYMVTLGGYSGWLQ